MAQTNHYKNSQTYEICKYLTMDETLKLKVLPYGFFKAYLKTFIFKSSP